MKVLLGVDGTESSLRALDRVTERAAETGDELTVAIVGDPDADTGFDSGTDIETRVRETLSRADLDARVRQVDGDLGGELVELAEAGEFDRLVVGGGEHSPMGKIDVSHHTQFLVLNARTSVTLIR